MFMSFLCMQFHEKRQVLCPMFQIDSCKKFLCFTMLCFPPATLPIPVFWNPVFQTCPQPAALPTHKAPSCRGPVRPWQLPQSLTTPRSTWRRSPRTAAEVTMHRGGCCHQALRQGRVLPPPSHGAVLRPPILSTRLCRATEDTRCFCFDLRVNCLLVYSCESINLFKFGSCPQHTLSMFQIQCKYFVCILVVNGSSHSSTRIIDTFSI